MAKSSLPKVHRYSLQFKATAVRLSDLPEVLIQHDQWGHMINGVRLD